MSDDLLPYYEQELARLRESSQDFAEKHPKVAGNLKISSNRIEDPHISRLLEGIAYLNANVQKRLDDDFPELTEGLLEVIYPHYARPIPASSIVQFMPASDLASHYYLNAETYIETDPPSLNSCRFKTIYPVDLWPIKVDLLKLQPRPFVTPGSSLVDDARSVLHIRLKSEWTTSDLSELNIKNLRFFIQGQQSKTYSLYQLLLNNCCDIFAASNDPDKPAIRLSPDDIKACGFNTEEGLYPYPEQSFLGYRLLTEYFICPEKFLFIEFCGLDKVFFSNFGDELNLYIYLNTTHEELEKSLNKDYLALGCTPAVNLFKHTADPINLDHTQTEYEIVPDVRRIGELSVYSVTSVSALSTRGEKTPYQALYRVNHQQDSDHATHYWHVSNKFTGDNIKTHLSLVDLNFSPSTPTDYILHVETLCTNNNQPSQLSFGNGSPTFHCLEASTPVEKVMSLTAPNESISPINKKGSRWPLISHWNLNHLSLTSGEHGLQALKEILSLYDFYDSPSTRAEIASITALETEFITAPLSIAGKNMLCNGTQITLTFDESLLSGSSVFLFASVLEQFFALYCSVNSFIRLRACLKGKEGVLKTWPPRSGIQPLV